MNSAANICGLVVVALSLYLVYMGFKDAIDKKKGGEQDLHVIQRQLRGFAYLALAPVALLLGLYVCGLLFLSADERASFMQQYGA